MNNGTFRVVTRGADGQIRIRDYDSPEAIIKRHSQVGVDDCSTNLGLRGLPVFRGLIGPMPPPSMPLAAKNSSSPFGSPTVDG